MPLLKHTLLGYLFDIKVFIWFVIAVNTTVALRIGMDDITGFFEPLIFADLLEISG
jgi:hypothetical protein